MEAMKLTLVPILIPINPLKVKSEFVKNSLKMNVFIVLRLRLW